MVKRVDCAVGLAPHSTLQVDERPPSVSAFDATDPKRWAFSGPVSSPTPFHPLLQYRKARSSSKSARPLRGCFDG